MRIRKFHLDMVNKIAGGFSKTTGIDQRELFAQGCYALCRAIETHSKSKGYLKYYISQCVKNELTNFIKKEFKFRNHVDIEQAINVYAKAGFFFEFYESLPSDSKEVVDIILSDPHLYLSVPDSLNLPLIKINIYKEKNWNQMRANKALKYLKKVLN